MEKYQEFFNEIGFLDEEEFLELKNEVNSIQTEKTKNGKILIKFIFNTIPSFKIVNIIEKNKNKQEIANYLQVQYRIVDLIEKDHKITDYLNNFISIKDLEKNLVLKNIIADYKINDENLIFNISTKTHGSILNAVLIPLGNYLNQLGLNFKDINTSLVDRKNEYEDIKKNNESISVTYKIKEENNFQKLNYIRDIPVPIKSISQINEFPKNLTIEGRIFRIIKPEKGRKCWEIFIQDETKAIDIKIWPTKEGDKFASGMDKANNLPVEYLETLKNDDFVKVKGRYDYSKGTLNLCFTAYSIYIYDDKKSEKKYDDAIKPRIEVLNHTKFSAFDGINHANEIVEYSIKNKSPGVGFCDRDNIQSFPNIDTASKKFNQKCLYGYELNLLNDITPCVINVTNNKKYDLKNQEYVVFDLETTSLINEDGEIIEFGGVKVKDGLIVERLDVLIKPIKPLSTFTSNFTHITNQMVKNCKSFSEEAQKIIDWIGDTVLVAHNGIDFDIRFLNKKLIQNNFKPLTNILIDTMQISRAINTDLTRHRLGIICRANKIQYDEAVAHRGDFDAEVLNSVWQIFIKKLKEMNITTINEINDKLNNRSLYENQFPSYVNIYTKNKLGLKTLYQLATSSLSEQLYRNKPTLFKKQINENRENLIICSNPYEGEIWDIAINGSDEELSNAIKFYDYIFIAPISCINHIIAKGDINKEIIERIINKIINVAIANHKFVVATSNNYYLDKTMSEAHNVFIHNKLVGGHYHRFYDSKLETQGIQPLFYNRTTKEMLEEFSFIGDKQLLEDIVINNTYKFANECENIDILLKGLYTPKIEGVNEKLRHLVYQTLGEIYGKNVNKLITNRIEKELNIIIGKGYSVIYWISYLLVKKSIEDGYVVGSRGSVGSSFVAYLSKISEVNCLPAHHICDKCKYHEFYENTSIDGFDLEEKICPICGAKMRSDGHNIPFESFLGTEGAPKVPDIDLNFSGEYQPIAHNFIHDMFGHIRAFRAGTVMTLAESKAYGLVKKYFEMTKPTEIPNNAEIYYLQRYLVDCKSNDGIHAGGMIVIPDENVIEDFCPSQLPPKGDEEAWFSTHFDFHAIHDNVLKFDILGHDFPTLLKMMKETSGCDPKMVDFQDNNVIKLFENLEPLHITPNQINGETIGTYGIPECGTSFTLGMIKEAKPKCFGDLIRISGLSHGTDVWNGNAKELIQKDNKELKDVVSFREDMLDFLSKNGVDSNDAFKFAELVRKGNQRKKAKEYDALVIKLREKNVPEWYTDSCSKIKYLFPKAHATAYMTASYICGWYKIYYPLDFYAAFFSIKAIVFDIKLVTEGSDAIKVKINDIEKRLKSPLTKATVTVKEENLLEILKIALEAIARGVVFKMIDIYKSHGSHFLINKEENSLLAPFGCIDGLGAAAADSIIEARRESKFSDLDDFKNRTKVNKKHISEFVNLGVIDNLDVSSQISLSNFFD